MQSTIYVEMAPGVRTQDLYQQLKSSYEVVIWFLLFVLYVSKPDTSFVLLIYYVGRRVCQSGG